MCGSRTFCRSLDLPQTDACLSQFPIVDKSVHVLVHLGFADGMNIMCFPRRYYIDFYTCRTKTWTI